MSAIIKARGLRKSFGGKAAVSGVSFTVEPGQCFGLLGPNGAGKTTTIKMLTGFSPFDSGELEIFGLPVNGRWREVKSRIGVCQQDNTLDPDLSVLQNLLVFASYFNISRVEAKARAAELLEFFALEARGADKVVALSGGLARRLSLARALINRPEILILDEPTTGLDPQSRHQVWMRLEELKKAGLTILLTTHYLEEAASLCDNLVIVDHGKILVEGPPGELISSHVGSWIMEIDDPAPGLADYLQSSGLSFDSLESRIVVFLSDEERESEAAKTCFNQGACVSRPATLEDVFLRLTGRELRE